jgi:hypothetical protein
MIGIEMKLNIQVPVQYQMGNPLQQGRWPCDLYIQSYLQFNIRYEKVERPAPVGGALVIIIMHNNISEWVIV